MSKSNVDGSFYQRVLDGSAGAIDWELVGGEHIGPVAVGRVGPAHASRIVAGYGFSIVTFQAPPWQFGWNTPVPQMASLTVGDVDGDGQDEVIHSDRFTKNIRVLDSVTQTERFAIQHTEFEAASLELGQFDGDPARELVFSSFGGNTRAFTAKVVDVATGATKAGLPILRGSDEHHFAVGDVDADGRLEIVLASGNSSVDGETEIRDAATNALEWRSPVASEFDDPFAGTPNTVLLAQLDADPALEIVLAGSRYRGFVRVLDGATHAIERLIRSDTTAPELEGEAIAEAALCQCDPDGQLDVAVMAASTGGIGGGHRVRVFSLVDGTQAWASPLVTQGTALANGIVVAQTDDDPAPELVGYDAWRIVAFDAYSHQEEWAIEGGAQRLAWAPGAHGGTLYRAIGTSLQRLRGNDRALLGADDYPLGVAGLHVPNATELLVASGDRLYRVAQSGGAPLDVSPSLGGFAGDRSGIATWLDAGALRVAVGSFRGRHVLALEPAQQILFSDGFE
ncbi:MAG TPA: hypothetical protein VFL14_03065, partial [Xanthomonadales bacterium]|nr:hypothetical protein [Xanthomonadales bacterium]